MSDFSVDDSILNDDNFKTAPSCSIQNIIPITSSGSIDQYKINQTIRIRERLAKLNTDDLRSYFKGVRELYDELVAKKEEYEIESIVHQENLKEIYKILQQLKDKFKQLIQNVSEQTLVYTKCEKELQNRIEKEAPELAKKIQELREMQRKLGYLKFSEYFTNLLDEVRRCLRKGSYQQLLENYRKLLRIPRDIPECTIDDQCHREYTVKSASLVQFLQLELHSSLANLFVRIHLPFEEPIDFNAFRSPLIQSVQILKCLKLVNMESLAANGTNNSKHSVEEPLELVLQEFTKRFNFHFYGEKATNLPTKPEWFFTQLSYWAENNVEYFEQHIQYYLLEMYPESKHLAKDQFLQHLMRLASLKCRELLHYDGFVQDRRQLSHLIDECVLFEKEMLENYGYPEESAIHVISELCEGEDALECWIKLERDTLSAGVDSILADPDAYEPRYKEAADVDPYLVPNFADSFVILMQSLSERYRSIPDWRLQCRFLKLQLVIVDEFRSRIVQIGQALYNPFAKPYPQLMNALWYLTLILDDWSDSPEFVRLQFFLQQLQSGHQILDNSSSSSSANSNSINSLIRGTFDESAILYRHVWRQKVRNLCESFGDAIRRKLGTYAREKWYDWEGPPRPTEITPSLEPFLRKVRELLGFLVENVSPDSILTLHHLTNHEVWTALDQCVISQTAFGYRGASQILFDTTHALIPLLNHCYGRTKGANEFDIFNEKCVNVLSTLRLLVLPPPTAILLKDELPRIPEHQLDQKLEQFEVMGLTKSRVIEIMEQRCDLVLLEKLIA